MYITIYKERKSQHDQAWYGHHIGWC